MTEFSFNINPFEFSTLNRQKTPTLDGSIQEISQSKRKHCIASVDASLELALLTPSDELLSVLVHRCLEESALPDFGLCAEHSVMATVRSCMASFNDLQPLHCWHASP